MYSAEFVSGRDLCRQFYTDFVRPVLDTGFPGLRHAAALFGRGSEVLGYDDEMSADHNAEPRVLIFLAEDDLDRYAARLSDSLVAGVPARLAGRPTQHQVTTIGRYITDQLRFDIDMPIHAVDWLTWPEARLIMITGGVIFHDDIGLAAAVDRFRYYPDDVWYYLMLAGWWRLHPEVNLVGRTGYVGDELGSSIIGAQLVRDVMRLCFLMERSYAPYDKWFGTAFSRLECGPEMRPILQRILRAGGWRQREQALLAAYGRLAAMHNALQITEPVPTRIDRLWDRPFEVLWGDFPEALRDRIRDPEVLQILDAFPVGGIDRPRETLGIPRDRLLLLVGNGRQPRSTDSDRTDLYCSVSVAVT